MNPEELNGLSITQMLDLSAVEMFKKTYPEISKEFLSVQQEQYNLFAKKMLDYGIGNISMGGNMQDEEDIKYSLTGVQTRLHDKISRIKNLLKNGKGFVVGESLEDTFIDIANYGIIGMIVGRKNWK